MKLRKNPRTLLVISVLLVFSLLATQASLLLRNKLLDYSFYESKYKTNKIYLYTESLIKKKINNSVDTNLIPNELLKNELPVDWVKDQYTTITKGLIDFYSGEANTVPSINTEPLITNYNTVKAIVINNKSVKLTLSQINELEKFKVKLLSTADLFPFSKGNIDSTIVSLNTSKPFVLFLYKMTAPLIILSLFFLILLLILAPKDEWAGYSFSFAGGLLMLPPIITLLFIKPVNLTLFLDSHKILTTEPFVNILNFKKLSISIVSESLSYMAITGGLFILIGIMLMALANYFSSRQFHFYFHHTPLQGAKETVNINLREKNKKHKTKRRNKKKG